MSSALRSIVFLSSPRRHFTLGVAKFINNTGPLRLSSDQGTDSKANFLDGNRNQLLVSDSCLKRLREICQDGSFLRVTVEGGGCSGFQYKFDLDKNLKKDDKTFGEENAKVVIDDVSLEYCSGSTVDYHTELIRSGFRMLANPQAEQGCSCGSSFAIKLD